MAAVVVAILGATAAGIGAERHWGARARAATGRVLDVMLYAVLPFVAFFVVARLELTTGVGAGLAFGYVVALTAGAHWRGWSASTSCGCRGRAPGRW